MSRPGRRPGPAGGEPGEGLPWPAEDARPRHGSSNGQHPVNGMPPDAPWTSYPAFAIDPVAAARPDEPVERPHGRGADYPVPDRYSPGPGYPGPAYPVGPDYPAEQPAYPAERPYPAYTPEPAGPAAPEFPRVNGARPPSVDDPPTQILRRYVPAEELLDREARDAARDGSRSADTRPPHPPRAVVRRRRARRRLLEWPFLVVFALVSAFMIRTLAVQTFYIPSGSMHETLLEGDRVLVNKLSYRLHPPHRGDVVVFRRPPNFQVEDDDLIKRVIGLPGDTVEARGRTVYVNHRALSEPYVDPVCRGTENFAPVTVPADYVWVMGDNRCDSSDSRVFGPIAEKLLVGRAFVLVWPPGRIAWL